MLLTATMVRRASAGLLLFMFAAVRSAVAANAIGAPGDHQLGTQYSPLQQINSGNVAKLTKAWEFHTGDDPNEVKGLVSMEDQPSLIEGNLVVCSINRRLIALNPVTGQKRWEFDPGNNVGRLRKCRGITSWADRDAVAGSECKTRIFLGTTDYRLVAVDARTGQACSGFGKHGAVQMFPSKPQLWPGEVIADSNPAVVSDVVVMGSSVADNQRVDAPSGRVLAFDARTGAARWQFDPVPRDPGDPAMATWSKGTNGFGHGNVWSSMAVDQNLDLVYLPTTSPSSDFYGGNRPGDNKYTTSVVAIRGSTGEVVWHQQLVHHNVWDYDVPAQPMLIDYPQNGKMVPALVQNTKMGMIFVFDRATGAPLVPLVERPVPQTPRLPGEVLSKTQPFPVGMPTLVKPGFTPDDVWGFTFIDKRQCRKKVEEHVYGPIYTPVTEQGTVVYPSVGGGANWGGGGYDPASHLMVVPTNRVPTIVTMVPKNKAAPVENNKVEGRSMMSFSMPDSPFVIQVEPLLSSFGAPCSAPPWAALTAVDIVNKKIVWEVPLGSIKKMAPVPINWYLGTPGAGGPLVTAGGLVFIGYSLDDTFRAFDLHTGKILWETDLPAAGTSVPVTYEANGEQYVVIPAGGHTMYASTMGNSVVAYKLSP
jgi:quinoprotein glucose dehydrogenase